MYLSQNVCFSFHVMFQLLFSAHVCVYAHARIALISHMDGKDLNVFVKICDTWIDHM